MLRGRRTRWVLLTERERRSVRERPRWLAWVLDEAAPTDADAVVSELPRPARVFYRRVLGPRFGAVHQWRLDMPTMQRIAASRRQDGRLDRPTGSAILRIATPRGKSHDGCVVRGIAGLMLLVAVTLAIAAALHLSGHEYGSDPFDPDHAGIAEAIIGGVLACAAIAMLLIPARGGSLGLLPLASPSSASSSA
jgi:hypothetical protein